MDQSLSITNDFPEQHGQRPARWFNTVGAAKEFIDYLIRKGTPYLVHIPRLRKGRRLRVAVVYVGPNEEDPLRDDPMMDVHVIPGNDIREHVSSRTCWCYPEEIGEHEYMHNALDRREEQMDVEGGWPLH